MKTLVTLPASVAVGSFVLALAVSPYAIAIYAVAFSAAFVALLANDYAPRSRRWEPRSLKPTTPGDDHHLQLAA